MSFVDSLMEKAVSAHKLESHGVYSLPRSFGVYRITAYGNVGKRHRFGNHAVREQELHREFGPCDVVAIFLDRGDAEALAKHLNS